MSSGLRDKSFKSQHFQSVDSVCFGSVCFLGSGIRVTNAVDRVLAGDDEMETLGDFGLTISHLTALHFALSKRRPL